MTDALINIPLAERRSLAYGFFAAIFEYPEGELTSLIREGTIAERARNLLCAVYPELAPEINHEALSNAGCDDDLAIEYTRLFDAVGISGGSCCSLNSSDYDADGRMSALEELLRFYNFFGLTTGNTPANELPDHLTSQFEFMYFLCYQEAQCAEDGEFVGDYQRAQRDFMERHPGKWVPMLRSRLEQHGALPFYLTVGKLLERFVQLEQQHLTNLVSRIAPPAPAMA